MTAQTWFLGGSRATLQAGPLAATLDLARPALGLSAVRCHGQPLALSLLALEAPATAQWDGASLAEGYVQCDNLVAVYRESPFWPVRVDGRWRAGVEGPLVVLDLVVSVRTSLLDSLPEMAVRSTVAASGAWGLVSAGGGRFEPCPDGLGPQASPGARDATAGLSSNADGARGAIAGLSRSADGTVGQANRGTTGCLLFRLPGEAWSCAAMVHPADFSRVELAIEPGEPRAFRLAHHLFSGRLEKGVILRARARCLLLPRDDDLSVAAAHYASWIAAAPPLGP
jgi:hypothetical protein